MPWARYVLVRNGERTLAGVAIALACGWTGQAPPKPPDLHALLELYGKGADVEVARALTRHFASVPNLARRIDLSASKRSTYRGAGTISPIDAFSAEFRATVAEWPPQQGAAFALEAAEAALPFDPLGATEVLEIGCVSLRRSAVPPSWELDWQLAAVAWLQGPYSTNQGAAAQHGDWPTGRPGLAEHLEHSLKRFPSSVALLSARALVHEQAVHRYLYGRRLVLAAPTRPRVVVTPGSSTARLFDGEVYGRGTYDQHARDAANIYGRLIQRPESTVRTSAALRLGLIQHRFYGKPQLAIQLWDRVLSQATSDSERFLALLFVGRLHAENGRIAEATSALERAIALRPLAESARTVLAAVRFLDGDRAGAADLIQHALGVSMTSKDDPWLHYFRGDHESWRLRLEQVRGRLE